MKKVSFIKILSLLSILLLTLILITACGGKDDKEKSGDVISNPSDYTIIRSIEASQTVKNAVSSLQKAIIDATGAEVTVSTDGKEESACEIIVGSTERQISLDTAKLGLGQYTIKQEGKKIIICGGSDKATANGVTHFIKAFVSSEGIKLPGTEEITFNDESAFKSITVDGVPINEFTVISNLYDKSSAESFVNILEECTYAALPIVDFSDIDRVSGKYIMIDDTNIDFSSYGIRIEDGNIKLYGNYASIDTCITAFFKDIMGYDVEEKRILGSKDITITAESGKSYTEEKSEVYSKDKLMNVLQAVYDSEKAVIIGQQMSERLGMTMEIERKLFLDNCGVEAALYGYDVGVMESNPKSTLNGRIKDAYDMIEYARDGGILTFSAHLDNPTGDGRAQGLDPHRGELGFEDKWDALMTEGTELNSKFMETLSEITDFLEIFHVNKVPVIFRPLHEMNTTAFWFCIIAEENGIQKTLPKDYAVRLWKYIYNYVVIERGIDSMIWEYSPNVVKRDASADIMYCYPGDEYCDIVGADWYTGEYDGYEMLQIAYEDLAIPTGKIFSAAEFGPGESIRTDFSKSDNYKFTCTHLDDLIRAATKGGVKTCYWMLWSSWGDVKISVWNMGDADLLYEDDRYLTLEDTAKLLYE